MVAMVPVVLGERASIVMVGVMGTITMVIISVAPLTVIVMVAATTRGPVDEDRGVPTTVRVGGYGCDDEVGKSSEISVGGVSTTALISSKGTVIWFVNHMTFGGETERGIKMFRNLGLFATS
jgi:hypothetical protein